MKIWSFTFGCKVNQYETELMRHRMLAGGSTVVSDHKEADLCLINSCSVTSFADKECRQMIRKVLRENDHARVIVTGCYATRAPEEVKNISPRLEVYTNQEKDELPTCLGFEVSSKPLGIHKFSGRTRAFLKIQDGCKAPCNYCIIPTIRPDMWNKPVTDVLSEFHALLENGYQEVVLTGIRLGLYQASEGTERVNLTGLLKKLTEISGVFRIRLSSLEVTEVSDRLIAFVRDNAKICRHFHIPMQSCDSDVLKAMGRWYDAPYYMDRIAAVRREMPDCGLTADVMVGYPTETDDQFINTYNNIVKMELSGLHVFRFSARETTPAAQLKPLDPKIISHRAAELGSLDKILREKFYRRFEGDVREVLPEPSGEAWSDNYIRVKVGPQDVDAGLCHRKVWSEVFPQGNLAVSRG